MPGESAQPGCIACTTTPLPRRARSAQRSRQSAISARLRARVDGRAVERPFARLQVVDGEPLRVHAARGDEQHARGRRARAAGRAAAS